MASTLCLSPPLLSSLWSHAQWFPVAPGLLCSEQGSEAKNKVFRNDRENHARQCGPLENLTDIGVRSHLRGDPQTQALMIKPKVHHPTLEDEVRACLADPDEVLVPPPAPIIIPDDEDDEMDANGDAPDAPPEAPDEMEVDD